MIKFFRKIRYDLMEKNKTGKYLKYAIGEIVLVVIGILIALSLNNWNQKQIEKKQIRNIYARIVRDFNNTTKEIERGVANMDITYNIMENIIKGDVIKDSLLINNKYFNSHFKASSGYPDIHIKATGISLLESKIELDYELNNELIEALTLLYSEQLYEIEVDAEYLENNFKRLGNYKIEKGVRLDYRERNNKTTFINMIFEDDMFLNYLYTYAKSLKQYTNQLKKFKTNGEVLIDKIKIEYNIYSSQTD